MLSAVTAWDEWFQSTFNEATPQDSGIRDRAERDRFVKEGQMLTQRIKREVLPGVVVEYGTVEGEALTVE